MKARVITVIPRYAESSVTFFFSFIPIIMSALVSAVDSLYNALPPRHIRILTLHKPGTRSNKTSDSTDVPDELLTCTMTIISLEDVETNRDKYSALSYCWRSTNESVDQIDIRCNDHIVTVMPNLHSALWHLSQQTDGPRAVWADALCINQSDVEEKTAQVSMMGDIYRSVGSVIVWLGPFGNKVKDLFTALSQASSVHRNLDTLELDSRWYSIQEGFTLLRRCGWFSRAWTFQEICQARSAVVRAGHGTNCMGNSGSWLVGDWPYRL